MDAGTRSIYGGGSAPFDSSLGGRSNIPGQDEATDLFRAIRDAFLSFPRPRTDSGWLARLVLRRPTGISRVVAIVATTRNEEGAGRCCARHRVPIAMSADR